MVDYFRGTFLLGGGTMEIPRPQEFQATALLPYIIHFPQINRRLLTDMERCKELMICIIYPDFLG